MVISIISVPVYSTLAATNSSYYVSPGGSDSNPGTLSNPWKTIQKAVNSVSAGDTVYIRAGTYREVVTLSRSGTSSAPISILAYPGEKAIVDGNNYSVASGYSPLVKITGSYTNLNGLEIRYGGMGLVIIGAHNLVSTVNVHHNQQNGVLVTGDYNTVTGSTVWSNCMTNVNGSSTNGWASGLSAARYPNYATLSNNVVYGNWGEGLSAYADNGTVLDGNTVYDNWSANLYVSDSTNVTISRNFIYATGAMTGGSQVGIMLGDETYNPPSANIKVINNIAYGNNRNFFWWQGTQGAV